MYYDKIKNVMQMASPLINITSSTGQSATKDVDIPTQPMVNPHVVASLSVQDFLRQQLTVEDDTINYRFMVKIGRLIFPIPYSQLLEQTNDMLAIDPAIPVGDSTVISYSDEGLTIVMKPYDKDEEKRKAEQKVIDEARAEMGKTLTVKRAVIEKGYGAKT